MRSALFFGFRKLIFIFKKFIFLHNFAKYTEISLDIQNKSLKLEKNLKG